MGETRKLNREQREAVEFGKGPLLIIAGAGTGKTTVITERIAHLLKNDTTPSEILALTFTEKAAKEMQERVDVVVPLGYTQMWISTFHAFCDRILRESAHHIGLDPKFKLLTQAQSIKLVKDNLFELNLDYFRPLGNPTKFIHGLVTHFSRLQDENITPDEYLKWIKHQKFEEKEEARKWRELTSAYQFYDELKIKNSLFDFGDLIIKTLLLFEKRPNVLAEYKAKFKFILIDEFQDTNFAQNLLAMKLAGKGGNITVVGDDDQSIYRFRGAAISNMIQFGKHYPKTKLVVLTRNYRSLQGILDTAYKVIQNNNPDRLEIAEKISKELKTQRKGSAEVALIHRKTDAEEAEGVVEKILDLVNAGYEYRDFAILVRANNHADPFLHTLKRLGVPYQFLGPAKLFQQEEIIDLISYLKVLYDFRDSVSFARLLTTKNFQVSGKLVTEMSSEARSQNISLFKIAEESKDEKISKLVDLVNSHLERKHHESAGTLLYEFLEKSGLLAKLLKEETEEGVFRANNISIFFDRVKNLEARDGMVLVDDVVDWISLSVELGDSPIVSDTDWSSENKVNILTIHSAKGLEFPVVFIANMVHLRFPSTNRSDTIPIPEDLIKEVLPKGDFHLEEERRLFYVALTRARDKVYLTAADHYGDSLRPKKLSQFALEAGFEHKEPQLRKTVIPQSGKVSKSPARYKLPTVSHLTYSRINSFQICPLHYKLGYILKIPTPASASQSVGVSVHETMKDVFLEIQKGQSIKNIDTKAVLAQNWIKRGFLDKKHEELSLKKAQNYINNYFKKDYRDEVPLVLEEGFSVNLPSINSERPLKIGGKIDRIDPLPGGGIEIIDYKTGNPPRGGQKDVDRDLQLSIYAIAAKYINQAPYKRELKEIKLSLYYFEEGVKFSTKRSESEVKAAIKEIYKVRDEIEKSEFHCSSHMFCRSCEYAIFCNEETKGKKA